ncbi:biotin-dependent carboxyltransferase family protein [Alteromonas sp. KUL49]|uniref:5-oxoprolinase subunit C family protein n=1 Tax=Alteromonas sp. KUL49 TaxID=2480798 RepID=UPI00102EF2E8|nr:biotin-dependent carboxyltransferase family protein [Alteromonas sp. KUL49]TAP40627.1 biotin-dependent carboxyltransferase [Alteromonas sp. KUL49]GEA10788.1 allophanate hydrolase [Alteromonas sp. KUL49]
MIKLIDSGLRSIIVDSGRRGVQCDGFCQSGPMDDEAYWWGNYMVGNRPSTPQLEVIGAVTLSIEKAGIVSVTGRGVVAKVNDKLVDTWQPIAVDEGDTLKFESSPLGTRSYLAVNGIWNVPSAIGSACTVTRESLGGLRGDGSPLQPDDRIDIKSSTLNITAHVEAESISPNYSLSTPIDVILGYQHAAFSGGSQRTFFNSTYTVSNNIDRMGYRLSGPSVVSSLKNLRSEGINLGDIQCPPDGQPIVMMRDRQTLGGYPKIGTVAAYDIGRLAQSVPGETVTFRQIDMNNARAKYLLHLAKRKNLIGEFGCL